MSLASCHVEQIIPAMSMSELMLHKIIPEFSIQIPATKRFPKSVYDEKKNGGQDVFKKFERTLFQMFTNGQSGEYIQNLVQLKTQFPTMQCNVQIFKNRLHSSVDMSIDNENKKHYWILKSICVLDPEKILLDVLLQKAILDKMEMSPQFIGLFYPMQNVLQWLDVSQWNSANLFNVAESNMKFYMGDLNVSNYNFRPSAFSICGLNIFGRPVQLINNEDIGSHYNKDGVFPVTGAFQTFLSNPQGMDMISENEILRLKNKKPPNAIWFIHASYMINLAQISNITIPKLQNEIYAAQIIGCSGVVFHTGKYINETYTTGFQNLVNGIREVLKYTTPLCPLIFETPAGQGTEICSSLEGLFSLCELFPNELGSTFKICIDTCHVFSLGYEPAFFIEQFLNRYPQALAVVHFNDSARERGARIDRHASPGLGYIGYERMMDVYYLCKKHQIPMIKE